MASKLPKPPRGATKAFKTHWEALGTLLESEGRLNDVNLAALLQLVTLHVERDEYAAQIKADGPTVKTSQGMSAHPLIPHVKAADNTIIRLKSSMGLDGKKVKPTRSMIRHRKPGTTHRRPD